MAKPKSEVELCSTIKAAGLFPGFTLHEEVGVDGNGNSVDMIYEHGGAVEAPLAPCLHDGRALRGS